MQLTKYFFSFIGHLQINRQNLIITLSMLRFGQTILGLKMIKNCLTKQKDKHKDNSREHCKYYNNQLNQSLTQSLDESKIEHIKHTVDNYLQNKITEDNLLNICDVSIVLEILKAKCHESETDNATTPQINSKNSIIYVFYLNNLFV